MTEVMTQTKATFSPEQLEIALLGDPVEAVEGVYDLFDRCLLAEQLIALKETANAVFHNELLNGDGIDVGISRRNMTDEVCTIIREFAGVENPREDFTYEVNGVPVRVKVFSRDYQFFKNPEAILYQNCMVNVPNPFEKYYKARHLIR